jgi:hypothetical protein
VRVDVVVASQRKLKESNEAGRTIVRSQGWVFKVDVIEQKSDTAFRVLAILGLEAGNINCDAPHGMGGCRASCG